jgi:hypothetical protein
MAWTIFDYLAEDGTNEIRDWIDSLPFKAQVKIDTRIRYLEACSLVWPENYISALRGCDDIYEFRIPASGVQYRPLGYYGPERGEFTILMGAIEKGGKLEPRQYCATATQRREKVNADRNRIIRHQFG